jgi:hypothetical protein
MLATLPEPEDVPAQESEAERHALGQLRAAMQEKVEAMDDAGALPVEEWHALGQLLATMEDNVEAIMARDLGNRLLLIGRMLETLPGPEDAPALHLAAEWHRLDQLRAAMQEKLEAMDVFGGVPVEEWHALGQLLAAMEENVDAIMVAEAQPGEGGAPAQTPP